MLRITEKMKKQLDDYFSGKGYDPDSDYFILELSRAGFRITGGLDNDDPITVRRFAEKLGYFDQDENFIEL